VKQIRTTEDIKRLGTILFVAAHPDDETFLAGGIMAAAVKNGQNVICVTATYGEAGNTQDESKWPRAALGDVRRLELQRALEELGVTEHSYFGYADGCCAAAPEPQAIASLRAVIEQCRPDTILTFGPEGLTGHPDHRAVSAWTDAALQGSTRQVRVFHAVQTPENYETNMRLIDKKMNLFFNIDKPPLVPEAQCAIACHLPPGIEAQKKRALAAMPSQTEALFNAMPAGVVNRAFACEYFIDAAAQRVPAGKYRQ
jgi:LmbE family N-acetylglucosaminyl deacetylase